MFRPGYVEPYEGESISHYLGRWRREEINSVSSPGALGRMAGIGSVTARWEKFRFYHFLTPEELAAVSKLMEMEAEELVKMLPQKGQKMKLEPIRLCAVCYREKPYHRLEWQFQSTIGCAPRSGSLRDRHKVRFLAKSINCHTPFLIPSQWEIGECQHCGGN